MAAETRFIPEQVSFSLFPFLVIRQVDSQCKRQSRNRLLFQISSALNLCHVL